MVGERIYCFIYAHGLSVLKTNSSFLLFDIFSVTTKKSPNVYKSCPKIISLEKLLTLTL